MQQKAAKTIASRLFKALIVLGLALGAALTLLGFLARARPSFDMVNDGLPFLLAGALVLLGLALLVRDRRLILLALLLAAVNAAEIVAGLQGAAPAAPGGSARFLRVVAFNLWQGNDRMHDIAKFLAETDADVVVLEESTKRHLAELRSALGSRYPNVVGDEGIVVLSKYKILADGRIDRAGFPPWIALMVRWVELDVNGTKIEVAGAHLTRPYYAKLQREDIAALTKFANSRTVPLVIAGDFNMTPWTFNLQSLVNATGLKRYNTFHFTWPMQAGKQPLLPLFAIDHVFATSQFAKIATHAGPRLGSDHRPIIADIALASPAPQ
jgi:endonuclease/exonuclease/phosphatase (EEP) superfamily protein YafD